MKNDKSKVKKIIDSVWPAILAALVIGGAIAIAKIVDAYSKNRRSGHSALNVVPASHTVLPSAVEFDRAKQYVAQMNVQKRSK
ncbi:MAG: hypothetical protein J6T57_02670 [Alphaproteobacteria bacterium]|nr:hypothetical protein [Alphaproteobacteria bacterium]